MGRKNQAKKKGESLSATWAAEEAGQRYQAQVVEFKEEERAVAAAAAERTAILERDRWNKQPVKLRENVRDKVRKWKTHVWERKLQRAHEEAALREAHEEKIIESFDQEYGKQIKDIVTDLRIMHHRQADAAREGGYETENYAALQRRDMLEQRMCQLGPPHPMMNKITELIAELTCYDSQWHKNGLSRPMGAVRACSHEGLYFRRERCMLSRFGNACPFTHYSDLQPGDVILTEWPGLNITSDEAQIVISIEPQKLIVAPLHTGHGTLKEIIQVMLDKKQPKRKYTKTASNSNSNIEYYWEDRIRDSIPVAATCEVYKFSKRIATGHQFARALGRETRTKGITVKTIIAMAQVGSIKSDLNLLIQFVRSDADFRSSVLEHINRIQPLDTYLPMATARAIELNMSLPSFLSKYHQVLCIPNTEEYGRFFKHPLLLSRSTYARNCNELEWSLLCTRKDTIPGLLKRVQKVGHRVGYLISPDEFINVSYYLNRWDQAKKILNDRQLPFPYPGWRSGLEFRANQKEADDCKVEYIKRKELVAMQRIFVFAAVVGLPPSIDDYIATFLD